MENHVGWRCGNRAIGAFLGLTLAACAAVLLPASDAAGQAGERSSADVFDLSDQGELGSRFGRVRQLLEAGNFAAAEREAAALAERTPTSPMPHYHLARVLARQGEHERAIEHLERAADRGFVQLRQLAGDPHLTPLHREPAFREVVQRIQALSRPDESAVSLMLHPPAAVSGTAVEDGVARISPSNTIRHAQEGAFRSYFSFEDPAPGLPVMGDGGGDEAVATLLNRWYEQGVAAGNHGDLYDNRDGGHSRLSADRFPQLTHIRYGEAARRQNLDTTAQTLFFFNHVTLGNCSMAMGHEVYWRSLPRLLQTNPRGIAAAHLQYSQNHLYVYPSHHDHRSDHGDLFPANTPYMIISQGSSGSDQPFVRAAAATLAAFNPETKRRLTRGGMLMPAVQMIFRRSNRPVRDDADYLTAAAHPTAFRGEDVDVERMVEMAQGMKADALPPLVRLQVVDETLGEVGRDYFAPAPREQLFDTPGAIARIFRTTEHTKRMVISAENSTDLGDGDLTFEWVVLRGDADGVVMTPQNDEGSVMEIEIPYHARGRALPRRDLASHRVDVGVFAHNGHHYSPPAFVSVYFIPGERRSYHEDGRIERVDYADPHVSRRYTDPVLSLPKDWADEYAYDEEGRLHGWTRVRGEERQRFTRDGAEVIETDDRGRPTRARTVRYVPQAQGENEPPRLTQQPGDTILHYAYTGPDDRIGRVARRSPGSSN